MKLGAFIALVVCVFASTTAHSDSSLIDQAAARSRARDHKEAIELYRRAYEADRDPQLLVRIAREYRDAGDAAGALAYFCSYMFVDAAGVLADEASANARAIAAQLGNRTQSDRAACATKAAVVPGVPVMSADLTDAVPRRPPRITKREIAGLITLGGGLASLGAAVLEAHRIKGIRKEIYANAPGTDLVELVDRNNAANHRAKVFLGIGGAALIAGVVLYLSGFEARKRAERAYVAPSVLKSGAGLVLGGKF